MIEQEEQHYYQEYAHCEGGKCKQCNKCYRLFLNERLPLIGIQRVSTLNPIISKEGECMMFVDFAESAADAKELIRRLMNNEYAKIMKKSKRNEGEGCHKAYVHEHGLGTLSRCVDVEEKEKDVNTFVRICAKNGNTLAMRVLESLNDCDVESSGELLFSFVLMCADLMDVMATKYGHDRKQLRQDFSEALISSFVPFETSNSARKIKNLMEHEK